MPQARSKPPSRASTGFRRETAGYPLPIIRADRPLAPGMQESSSCAPCRLAPAKLASSRTVLRKSTSARLALVKSAPVRLAPAKSAPLKFALLNRAPSRLEAKFRRPSPTSRSNPSFALERSALLKCAGHIRASQIRTAKPCALEIGGEVSAALAHLAQ